MEETLLSSVLRFVLDAHHASTTLDYHTRLSLHIRRTSNSPPLRHHAVLRLRPPSPASPRGVRLRPDDLAIDRSGRSAHHQPSRGVHRLRLRPRHRYRASPPSSVLHPRLGVSSGATANRVLTSFRLRHCRKTSIPPSGSRLISRTGEWFSSVGGGALGLPGACATTDLCGGTANSCGPSGGCEASR